jgi:type 1 fimbria pilin
LVFRDTRLGASTRAKLTLRNPGAGLLTIRSAQVTGTNAADFTLVARSCTRDVWPSGSCRLIIEFTPGAAGPRAATLLISDNTAIGQETVPMSGLGVLTSLAIGHIRR